MASSSSSSSLPRNRHLLTQNEGSDVGIFRNTPQSAQSHTSTSTAAFFTPVPPSPLVLDPARVTPMQPIRYKKTSTPASYRTPHQQQRTSPHPSQQLVLSHERKTNDTAAAFARTAPQAGYLYKLGSHIPEFKRRFFVLKPSTHLYYFVSPHDTEPRGCIDLDGSQIQPLETLPDGAVRFAIRLLDQEKSVVLEARANGPAWMESLQTERLSFCQQELLESGN
ncbi:PH domain [Fragilaria crotonensis]|nr:PH domain [Fragilaria crotonensis]